MMGRPLSWEWPHWLARTAFYFLRIHLTAEALGYAKTIVFTLKKKNGFQPNRTSEQTTEKEKEGRPQFSLGIRHPDISTLCEEIP